MVEQNSVNVRVPYIVTDVEGRYDVPPSSPRDVRCDFQSKSKMRETDVFKRLNKDFTLTSGTPSITKKNLLGFTVEEPSSLSP